MAHGNHGKGRFFSTLNTSTQRMVHMEAETFENVFKHNDLFPICTCVKSCIAKSYGRQKR